MGYGPTHRSHPRYAASQANSHGTLATQGHGRCRAGALLHHYAEPILGVNTAGRRRPWDDREATSESRVDGVDATTCTGAEDGAGVEVRGQDERGDMAFVLCQFG